MQLVTCRSCVRLRRRDNQLVAVLHQPVRGRVEPPARLAVEGRHNVLHHQPGEAEGPQQLVQHQRGGRRFLQRGDVEVRHFGARRGGPGRRFLPRSGARFPRPRPRARRWLHGLVEVGVDFAQHGQHLVAQRLRWYTGLSLLSSSRQTQAVLHQVIVQVVACPCPAAGAPRGRF